MAFDADLWRQLGSGEPPPQAGRYSGPLLILGGGRSVWDDLAAVGAPAPDGRGHPRWKGEVMAVNDIGQHFQGLLRHWVTLHPDYFPGWTLYRDGHNYGHGIKPVTHSQFRTRGSPARVQWQIKPRGTSGLYATVIGLLLGYDEIVLAGLPFDNSGHYFDDPNIRTSFADKTQKGEWLQARERWFKGRVTSCSGWTRSILGAPAGIRDPLPPVTTDHSVIAGGAAA